MISTRFSSLSGRQPERIVVAPGDPAQRLDDQVVIFALRQAGDGDAANYSGIHYVQREAAAVRSIILFGQIITSAEAQAALLEQPADVIRTFVKPRDNVDLARDPALIVRRGSGERGVEELLVRRSEPAHVDYQRSLALKRHLPQCGSDQPGGIGRELVERERGFLLLQRGD